MALAGIKGADVALDRSILEPELVAYLVGAISSETLIAFFVFEDDASSLSRGLLDVPRVEPLIERHAHVAIEEGTLRSVLYLDVDVVVVVVEDGSVIKNDTVVDDAEAFARVDGDFETGFPVQGAALESPGSQSEGSQGEVLGAFRTTRYSLDLAVVSAANLAELAFASFSLARLARK